MIYVKKIETGWEVMSPEHTVKRTFNCKVPNGNTLVESTFTKEYVIPKEHKKYKFFRDALDHAHFVNKNLCTEIRVICVE